MNWYLLALKNYFDFTGRARRKEFWYFILFNMLALLAFTLVDDSVLTPILSEDFVLGGFYFLFSIIPLFSVTIRRLHDLGKSGLNIFIYFIPFVGVFWLITLLASEGEKRDNEYGMNPKGINDDWLEDFGKKELKN